MAKFYPAPILRRIIALFIDLFILFWGVLSIIAVLEDILSYFMPYEYSSDITAFVALSIVILYFPMSEMLMRGRTLGKMITGIKVVTIDGSPVTMAGSIQRFVMLPVDLLITTGVAALISMMVTSRRQRLGDIMAGTMVVTVNTYRKVWNRLFYRYISNTSPYVQHMLNRMQLHLRMLYKSDPLMKAQMYREVESDIASLRTHKAPEDLIDCFERLHSSAHLSLCSRHLYDFKDFTRAILHNVPYAMYASRWAVLASVVICIAGYFIGVYSQIVDYDFFRDYMGDSYYELTISNMKSGDPMGRLYGSTSEFSMAIRIFINNFLVSLKLYVSGIFVFFGPLSILLSNLVMIGTFETFFAQNGYLAAALISPNEHGMLEITSIVICGGAAIRLGTGWLFPGRLSRWEALRRSAYQSILVFLSTVPPLFVAAFIEGFVTRHTEWPMTLKMGIIIVSALFILTYYVVLPAYAYRRRNNP